MNADCEYIGARSLRRPNYTEQARCGIRRVGAFLDKLRELGLYDSSLIVISSDHGVALPPAGFPGDRDVFGGPLSEMSGSALALLVVKPPHGHGSGAHLRGAERDQRHTRDDRRHVGSEESIPGYVGAEARRASAPRPRQFAVYLWSSSDWRPISSRTWTCSPSMAASTDGSAWKTEEPIYAPKTTPEGRSRGFYRPERGAPGQIFRWSSPIAISAPAT